ncbi:M23 family metallopeptidase [Haloechinothrix sp. YIM 98757]|uniref:M23 family metallopeptidase n=1 Tax=Haloechinothrix aidingensis TaxID=2752311 RepID=A0A838A107_9PSEU|nr:M23 family metallopeptidase [Haloechinothrix aidingensis]MBA0124813.1 M23 family metallopeptidase [Haloechinothrix aidingensis]
MVVAAVAAGAFAAATAGQTIDNTTSNGTDSGVTPLASSHDAEEAEQSLGMGGGTPVVAPEVLPADTDSDASNEAEQLAASHEVTQERLEREREAARRAAEEAARPSVVKPAEGTLTSAFGARWGSSHNGIDIAAPIGSPIHAAADGTVIEAGPASGFGLWVRIQHDDGHVSVYGHMNSYSVAPGQRVEAGQQIAEVGNRGQSTGPHLHFEVWQGDGGAKLDPLTWLAQHGIHY